MNLLNLPRTQEARALVLDQVLRNALARHLPIPGVQFLEFPTGFRVELNLPPGDRAGVDRWATLLSLPAAAVFPDALLYAAELHAPGSDVWCGACWVLISCELTTHKAGT